METIEVIVLHYYSHPIYYPFMTESLFEVLQDAFMHNEITAKVPKSDFDKMINAYMATLKN